MRFIADLRSIARQAPRRSVLIGFAALAAIALAAADLSVPPNRDPWGELGRLLVGFFRPEIGAVDSFALSFLLTASFALLAVALSATLGLCLAPFYAWAGLRHLCIVARSVHELFWALLLMQVFGLTATTGILAIAVPYTGIFAKVFAEILDEVDRRPAEVAPPATDRISLFLFTRLPMAAAALRTYTLYRVECAIRSSAVLGFIGLPTLGFQLDGFFKQGHYGAAGAILLVFFVMIATMRLWLRWHTHLLGAYLVLALVTIQAVESPPVGAGSLWRLLTEDFVPAPLRQATSLDIDTLWRLIHWLRDIAWTQALPGIVATLVVAQLALMLCGLIAALGFVLIVPRVVSRPGAFGGHMLLVVGRSMPEYILAFIFLQMLGPSMLPAILALALHNGAIIGHLLGREATELCRTLRPDAPRGLDLYAYELFPRLFGTWLSLCLYRWEIIIRESAIVGVLGIMTLGFYIDSAVAELKLDRVIILLAATSLVTICVDALSRRLRTSIGSGPLVSRQAAGDRI